MKRIILPLSGYTPKLEELVEQEVISSIFGSILARLEQSVDLSKAFYNPLLLNLDYSLVLNGEVFIFFYECDERNPGSEVGWGGLIKENKGVYFNFSPNIGILSKIAGSDKPLYYELIPEKPDSFKVLKKGH